MKRLLTFITSENKKFSECPKNHMVFLVSAILILSVFSISIAAASAASECNLWCKIVYLFTGKLPATGGAVAPTGGIIKTITGNAIVLSGTAYEACDGGWGTDYISSDALSGHDDLAGLTLKWTSGPYVGQILNILKSYPSCWTPQGCVSLQGFEVTSGCPDPVVNGWIFDIEAQAQAVCGDGICDSGETQTSCCQDCGCPSGQACIDNSCQAPPAVPTCGQNDAAGMVSYWKFDETSGTTASDSVDANNGTLTGMDPATDWVQGKIGKALDFDGSNDYVNISDSNSLNISGEFTIEAWIYNMANGWRGIAYKGQEGENNWHFGISPDGYLGGGFGSGSDWDTRFGAYVTQNAWVHVAMVGKAYNYIGMYINGIEVNKEGLAHGFQINTKPLTIGKGYGEEEYLNGRLDEIAIYNRALSRTEISVHYARTSGGVNPYCTTGPAAVCGNSIIETGEQCDPPTSPCTPPTGGSCTYCNSTCQNVTLQGPACTTGQQRACPLQAGVCAGANETCTGGAWPGCTSATYTAWNSSYVVSETTANCDNKDNDCDGTVDEGCACISGTTRVCGTDVGECQAGLQTCTAGQWGTCVGEIIPTAEICDNKDNDCDNQIDEGLSRSQSCGVGACARTITQTCSAGNWNPACVPGAPGAENTTALCTDGIDNDCDGLTDFPADTNSCTIGGQALPNCVLGDVNGDGVLNIQDIISLEDLFVGNPISQGNQCAWRIFSSG